MSKAPKAPRVPKDHKARKVQKALKVRLVRLANWGRELDCGDLGRGDPYIIDLLADSLRFSVYLTAASVGTLGGGGVAGCHTVHEDQGAGAIASGVA